MATTLELFDITGDKPEPTGSTATLGDDGKVTYEGRGVENIIERWLDVNGPEKVFSDFTNWSNAYQTLKRR